MEVTFSSDELILTMVSLIRATDPRLLVQGPDGVTVDFASIERKQTLTEDERLLMKIRTALEAASDDGSLSLHLSSSEGHRLAGTLDALEKLQQWAPDVLAMSRGLQARLHGLTESAG